MKAEGFLFTLVAELNAIHNSPGTKSPQAQYPPAHNPPRTKGPLHNFPPHYLMRFEPN